MPMDFYDIHTHRVSSAPETCIVSCDVAAGTIGERVVYASAGIHPWSLLQERAEEQRKALLKALKDRRVIALGEVGLDKLKGPSIEFQTVVLRQETDLAEALHLPSVIHCVRAFNELISLKKACNPKEPWVIHGFRGKESVARMLLEQGCYLSFGEHFQEAAVRAVPLERLFIETDESAEPVEKIYRRIALVRGISLEELAEGVKNNVHEVFFRH